MSKKKLHNFNISITLNDGGLVMSESQWMSAPQIIYYEENKDMIDENARQSDTNYRAKEAAKRRFERVEDRRKLLQLQQSKIQAELLSLD